MIALILTVIIFFHIFLLSKTIFFPYPELFVYPYLTKIGLLPYRQILDQHFPGAMFFPVNLASLGIDTPSEMRILQLFLVALNQLILFLIARKMFRSFKKALLINLIYLPWQIYLEGYVLWVESFVTPLILSSYLCFLYMEERYEKRFSFLTGLILGIALIFKQVLIPLLFMVILYTGLIRKKWKDIAYLLSGMLIPVLVLTFFVITKGIYADFIYWTFTFNLTGFAATGRTYPGIRDLVKISPVFFTALAGTVVFLSGKFKDKYPVLIIYFTGCLFYAFARFDFIHLQPALPFSILLSVLLANAYLRNNKILLTVYFLVILIIPLRYIPGLLGSKVMFYDETEKKVAEKVLKYAGQGESVFAFGTLAHIYQMTSTVPPGRIFVFQFPWFIDAAGERIYEGILSDPPKVVIKDPTATVAGINLVKHMGKIDAYVGSHYKTVDKVDNIEIMVPNSEK